MTWRWDPYTERVADGRPAGGRPQPSERDCRSDAPPWRTFAPVQSDKRSPDCSAACDTMRLATTAALFALHAICAAGEQCPCEDLVIDGIDDFIIAYWYSGFELELSVYDGTYTRTSGAAAAQVYAKRDGEMFLFYMVEGEPARWAMADTIADLSPLVSNSAGGADRRCPTTLPSAWTVVGVAVPDVAITCIAPPPPSLPLRLSHLPPPTSPTSPPLPPLPPLHPLRAGEVPATSPEDIQNEVDLASSEGRNASVFIRPGSRLRFSSEVVCSASIHLSVRSTGSGAVLDGEGRSRIMSLSAGCSLSLENFHVVNGASLDRDVIMQIASLDGGAIVAQDAGNIALVDVSFTGCESGGFGGAVSVRDSGDVSMNAVAFTSCTAVAAGGAVELACHKYECRMNVSLTDVIFTGCKALEAGALSLIEPHNVLITRTSFVDCHAKKCAHTPRTTAHGRPPP